MTDDDGDDDDDYDDYDDYEDDNDNNNNNKYVSSEIYFCTLRKGTQMEMLRNIFWTKSLDLSGPRGDSIMRSVMVCSRYQMSLG
jgi:hypothetical protein